jgi:hypothetical protein
VALAGSQVGSGGHRELVNCMCFKRVPHIGEYDEKANFEKPLFSNASGISTCANLEKFA